MKPSPFIIGPVLCLLLASASQVFGADPETPSAVAPERAPILLASRLPADIPGGAEHATLDAAARFAWQEFIALNWPAKEGERDVPDNQQPFGAQAGPLVWQTYRAKSEIYPGLGSASVTPHGYDPQEPDYGYNAPPQYDYNTKKYSVTPGQQNGSKTTPWVNLDEISEIGLNMMYAGIAPDRGGPNSSSHLIRFMAKANRAEYKYVCQNKFWYSDSGSSTLSPLQVAQSAFIQAIKKNQVPTGNVSFPDGTVEVKSAWRQLGPGEDASRFHTAVARFYELGPDGQNNFYYYDERWALIALHIIHKTPSAQAFVWATFEQADNILDRDNDGRPIPVEDVNGKIIHRPETTSTTPSLTYKDAPPPGIPKVERHGDFVIDPGPRLFYHNTSEDQFVGKHNGLPHPGSIQINFRDHAIPEDIQDVNVDAHAAIAAYNKTKGITSPWSYYKLVNVQAFPFDYSEVDPAKPDSPHGVPTYRLANSVVETDATLQNFSGRIAPNSGAPTNYPPASVSPNQLGTPPNVILAHQTPFQKFNMGGCMGCHGNVQAQGSDFSFILGSPVAAPEAPGAPSNGFSLALKAFLSTGQSLRDIKQDTDGAEGK